MPFDGFVTQCIAEELNILLAGGRIDKIQQPERDEIRLTIRNNGVNYRLLMSSNAASPRIHLTESVKENPEKAPMFCMLLRKHLGGGRVTGVQAGGLERVVKLDIESVNELGDKSVKALLVEIMGKHSNIILINAEGRIIDSIIHVDHEMSSVREVMPARLYSPPPPQLKLTPGEASAQDIIGRIASEAESHPDVKTESALLGAIMGASPLFCKELCHRAGADGSAPVKHVGASGFVALRDALSEFIVKSQNKKYEPCIVLGAPDSAYADFYCWNIGAVGAGVRHYETMNAATDDFYDGRARDQALAQRKSGLVRLVSGQIARCRKKLAIQQESLREAANRDDYKLYGELITANMHNIPQGAASVRLFNYYGAPDAPETAGAPPDADVDRVADAYIDVALDGTRSPQRNAQDYFKKYRKAVSTWKNAGLQAEESEKELSYLESVLQELEMSQNRREIDEIRQELVSQKYISESPASRKNAPAPRKGARGTRGAAAQNRNAAAQNRGFSRRGDAVSQPRAFRSSDGLTIFVGKNNRQNDQLALKTASSYDIWLHAKNIAGSHVIIKKQQGEIPPGTLYEAASLAALFSKARMGGNVVVDYTEARHVRKPSGARPGMVIYDNQRSLTVSPDEALATRLACAPLE